MLPCQSAQLAAPEPRENRRHQQGAERAGDALLFPLARRLNPPFKLVRTARANARDLALSAASSTTTESRRRSSAPSFARLAFFLFAVSKSNGLHHPWPPERTADQCHRHSVAADRHPQPSRSGGASDLWDFRLSNGRADARHQHRPRQDRRDHHFSQAGLSRIRLSGRTRLVRLLRQGDCPVRHTLAFYCGRKFVGTYRGS